MSVRRLFTTLVLSACVCLGSIVTVVHALADVLLFSNPSMGPSAPTAIAIYRGYVSWDDFNLTPTTS